MIKLSEEKQRELVSYVNSTYRTYVELMKPWKERMLEIDTACKTFKYQKANKWNSSFKVNKAHEIENKVTPRIVSNNPKWIVTPASDEFDVGDIDLPEEERMKKVADYGMYALAIRDYLSDIFEKGDTREVVKIGAKNLVRHGLNWRKVNYKYVIGREGKMQEEEEYDEAGNVVNTIKKKVKEKVIGEYPTLDNVSWTDIYYDIRYVRLEDMPAVIEEKSKVRLSFFTQDKKRYMNVDMLVDYCNCATSTDADDYRNRVYAITGIMPTTTTMVDKNNLTVRKFYGYYDTENEDLSDEKLYECWIVNDCVLVYAKEITQIPFEDAKCFEDTETHLPTGFIEPILGLQDEMNFKKNSASEYINQGLNRTYVRSPNSGINPKSLISAPGAIIPTTRSGEEAMRNLIELPLRHLPPEFFQEQNDFERQIQSMTFTIDTTSNNSNEALTNTATGIKVKVFESNNVMNDVRKNFEYSLARIAYKLLEETYNNLDDNIVIKKADGTGFWEIHKEAMRDALRRYSIVIETGSSTSDGIEQRRANAIAMWNFSQQANAAGVPVDMTEGYLQVMSTFEGVDTSKLIRPIRNPMEGMPQPQGGVSGMPSAIPGMPGTPGIPKKEKLLPEGGPIQQPLKTPQGISPIMAI